MLGTYHWEIGVPRLHATLDAKCVKVVDEQKALAQAIRNLGVIFDEYVSINDHLLKSVSLRSIV